MIKAVFFDMYGTLAGFNPSRFEIQSMAAAEFGLRLTEEGVLRGYAEADSFMAEQNLSEPLRTLDEAGKEKFFAEYEKRVLMGSGLEIDLRIAGDIWHRVRQIPYEMTAYPDVEPTLATLRELGLKVAAISNMNRTGKALAVDLGLKDSLDFVVTSLEAGAEKPHAQIFVLALARAGVEPKEAVHVGDQITSDVEGAKNVGMRAVLIDRDGNHDNFSAAPRIEALDDLIEVVKRL